MTTLRYWAAARAAAGVAEETFDAATLADLVHQAKAAHPGERFARVLDRCSWVVDAVPVGTRAWGSVALGAESVVDALPPFAGGTLPS